MPNSNTTVTTATILDITSNISPVFDESLGFALPFANSIYIMSSEHMALDGLGLFYGDEMTFQFWSMLHMPIGTKTDTNKIWTLQTGYKYIFYFTQSKFRIYNAQGTLVHSNNNIKTIADLHIDFTIHKSHQFVISLDADDDRARFIFPIKAVKKVYQPSPVFGITDGAISDTLEKHRGEHINKYEMFESSGVSNKKEAYKTYYRKRINTLKKINPLQSLNAVSYDRIKNTNAVYSIDGYNYFSDTSDVYNDIADDNPKLINPDFVSRLYKIRFLLSSPLIPNLSISLFPQLQRIIRPGESHNNRPVYEPWLIWGVFKFIWLKRTDPGDAFEIDVFDLSPNWSY